MTDTDRQIRVLVADDEAPIRDALQRTLSKEGYAVVEAQDGALALDLLRKTEVDLILVDLRMPKVDGLALLKAVRASDISLPVIMITGHGTIDDAVQSLKLGAFDFIQKPFKRYELLRAVEKAVSTRKLIEENRQLREKLAASERSHPIIGTSPAMRDVLDLVAQVAPSLATALIRGESGTGKELVAEALHRMSRRADRPFVRVSCAALPETLLEAELFGHERGAFTGAVSRRKGRFEVADTGTLFLDEISELSPVTQVKLLRVLQEGEFERIGSSTTLRVDVRLVAATNADLRERVKEGRFREDLFYRLNVVEIRLPPLRERPGDIMILADHFRQRFCARDQKRITGFTDRARDALESYRWPGNVRELENAIERAVVLTTGDTIDGKHLPKEVLSDEESGSEILIPIGTTLDDAKCRIIRATLHAADGDKKRAAEMLGIATRTVYRTLERFCAGGGNEE